MKRLFLIIVPSMLFTAFPVYAADMCVCQYERTQSMCSRQTDEDSCDGHRAYDCWWNVDHCESRHQMGCEGDWLNEHAQSCENTCVIAEGDPVPTVLDACAYGQHQGDPITTYIFERRASGTTWSRLTDIAASVATAASAGGNNIHAIVIDHGKNAFSRLVTGDREGLLADMETFASSLDWSVLNGMDITSNMGYSYVPSSGMGGSPFETSYTVSIGPSGIIAEAPRACDFLSDDPPMMEPDENQWYCEDTQNPGQCVMYTVNDDSYQWQPIGDPINCGDIP